MAVLLVFCCLLGWALLSIGLPRHHLALLGHEPARQRTRWLRAAGWTVLGLALPACVGAYGWGQGPIFWASGLVLAAILWALLMGMLSRT